MGLYFPQRTRCCVKEWLCGFLGWPDFRKQGLVLGYGVIAGLSLIGVQGGWPLFPVVSWLLSLSLPFMIIVPHWRHKSSDSSHHEPRLLKPAFLFPKLCQVFVTAVESLLAEVGVSVCKGDEQGSLAHGVNECFLWTQQMLPRSSWYLPSTCFLLTEDGDRTQGRHGCAPYFRNHCILVIGNTWCVYKWHF